MPSSPSKFKSLNDLALEWSEQGGEPPLLTLRRICDWAICEGFPEGTIIFPNGQKIDLLELHRAMRSVTGLGALINENMAIELLQRTLVNVAGIRAFCERTGVDPPGSIKTLRSIFRQLANRPQHLSPPDCPNSADIVARLEAMTSAIGTISALKFQLRQQQEDLESNISDHLNERWHRYVKSAQSAAESSGDPEIQRELASLEREWESLKAARNHLSDAAAQPDDNGDVHSTKREKRAAGRPPGSGSFERSDLEQVQKMREGIENGLYSSIAAAARALAPRAAGHGTLSSKEKRLTNRYSDLYRS